MYYIVFSSLKSDEKVRISKIIIEILLKSNSYVFYYFKSNSYVFYYFQYKLLLKWLSLPWLFNLQFGTIHHHSSLLFIYFIFFYYYYFVINEDDV